jgi:hypothetical protein
MFFRKSRARRTRDEVREQVTELTDDLATALEAAREAITRASTVASRRSAELGKQAGRRGAKAGRRGARAARGMAKEAAERLPEPEQVADLTRRAADKLFPERARQRQKAKRRRRVGLLTQVGGLLGIGLLVGWLTAPKRGAEARKALKEQAAKASEKGWERVSTPETTEPEQAADVTPIHQGDGASTSSQTRIPPS